MNSTTMKIKKLLSNRNTVILVCAIIGIAVLFVGYNLRVNSAIQPQEIPYAKVSIQPRTKITDDMIGYINVPKAAVEDMGGDKLILNKEDIINKYSNVNTMIPAGSMFYSGAVVDKSQLPDKAVYDVEEGNVLAYLTVNMATSYVNSIVPDGFIDLYVRTTDHGQLRVGKFVENIKVLAVKTSDGLDVFENSDEARVPAFVLFSIPKETFIYLHKAAGLGLLVIPVPTNAGSLPSEDIPTGSNMTSEELKAYIDEYATEFVQDSDYIIDSGDSEINTDPNANSGTTSGGTDTNSTAGASGDNKNSAIGIFGDKT